MIRLSARLLNVERNWIRLFLVACFSSPTSFAVWDITDVQETRSCKKGFWLGANVALCNTCYIRTLFTRSPAIMNTYATHVTDTCHYPFLLFFPILCPIHTSPDGKVTTYFLSSRNMPKSRGCRVTLSYTQIYFYRLFTFCNLHVILYKILYIKNRKLRTKKIYLFFYDSIR